MQTGPKTFLVIALRITKSSCILEGMDSLVSKRWQTVIPAAIRRRHNIREGDRLVWIDDGETIRVVPIPADPVQALYGRAKGERLNERLLAARAEDRRRERQRR